LEQRLEHKVISTATGLVTVSKPLADTLKRKFGKPTEVILNGFDAVDYPILPEMHGRDDTLRIVYTGMIYVDRQSPAPLFDALQQMGEKAEKVRVVFYGDSRKLVQELASSFGVLHLVENNESVPHRDALIAQSEADILLHLLWNDPTQPGVYNAKVFEYLGARRPILAVGYKGNVTAQLIQERGAGVALDDPVAIASQLEQWIGQKQLTGKIPALDPSLSTGLSREEQTKKLETFLRQCLDKRVV
jgi:glycosyltransferase involved in cell wall biosynthesis